MGIFLIHEFCIASETTTPDVEGFVVDNFEKYAKDLENGNHEVNLNWNTFNPD